MGVVASVWGADGMVSGAVASADRDAVGLGGSWPTVAVASAERVAV